jgi:membrane protein DedA with SNARE-associated domain
MFDVAGWLAHWGYGAIFVAVVLGNVGLPVPEETVLALGGYLAERGQLRLAAVLAVSFVSAVAGDGLGYWLGRRYGRAPIERYGHWLFVTPTRLEKVDPPRPPRDTLRTTARGRAALSPTGVPRRARGR